MIDDPEFDYSRLRGHRHITDAYLLALAVANEGQLATFDSAIAATVAVVRGANTASVMVLSERGGPRTPVICGF